MSLLVFYFHSPSLTFSLSFSLHFLFLVPDKRAHANTVAMLQKTAGTMVESLFPDGVLLE